MDFQTTRSLLNPKFEGYKLEPIAQENAVSRYTLSRKPTQATASTRVPLSFEEMRSRITHNHLAVDREAGLAAYVDQENFVSLVGLDTTRDEPSPSVRMIYEMPTPMDISGDDVGFAVKKEYPSASFLGANALAVTDGAGLLYILPVKDEPASVEPVGIFTLSTGGPIDSPFRIHYSHRASPVASVLLLSSRYYPPNGPSHSQVEFDIWAVKIGLLGLSSGGAQVRQLDVLWHRRGRDVPIYMTFVEEIMAYLVIGGSTYPDPSVKVAKPYEPSSDELAPIPHANEALDDLSEKRAKPHPYSWTQTSDSVTVAFPLPSNTPKNKMKVIFTVQTLTLHIDSYPLQSQTGVDPLPIPHYSTKALWDSINTSSCFWTWDREAEHVYGLLTLHMEKKNEDTRWMQVFASSATSADEEVPESVDPSEMASIRESFEKWTASLSSGADASGLGLGQGLPSLMGGEADEEADAAVGRAAWATWIVVGGETPEWSQQQWEDEPITLLSTPLPGSAGIELVVKHDLDGTVFSLDKDKPGRWKHTSTYSALAFVLASKQDTRFTYHLPSQGVLAFEGGSVKDRGANVYVYRPPAKGKGKWAKQSVLQIDNGGGGALLGVGSLKGILVCLTEGELVLIKGI